MEIKIVPVGELMCNCYLIIKNEHVLVIDPGDDAFVIKQAIGDLKVDGIIVTHHHFDHVGALKEIQDYYSALVYDYHNLEEKMYTIGEFMFDVIYTPGHTEDSITIYFKDENVMFTGDFLFYQSIGRTDLFGGDEVKMMDSLKKIKQYPSSITFYPGHGPKSTLEYEKQHNYFLQMCDDVSFM